MPLGPVLLYMPTAGAAGQVDSLEALGSAVGIQWWEAVVGRGSGRCCWAFDYLSRRKLSDDN